MLWFFADLVDVVQHMLSAVIASEQVRFICFLSILVFCVQIGVMKTLYKVLACDNSPS